VSLLTIKSNAQTPGCDVEIENRSLRIMSHSMDRTHNTSDYDLVHRFSGVEFDLHIVSHAWFYFFGSPTRSTGLGLV
jgi:hypothetical protein